MMSKIFAFLLLAMVAGTSTAFTTGPNSRVAKSIATTTQQQKTTTTTPVVDMPSFAQTSTSLNLKVKVDPNAKANNSKGNAKAAAYGGSIAIAALLPIGFLIWSAFNKGS